MKNNITKNLKKAFLKIKIYIGNFEKVAFKYTLHALESIVLWYLALFVYIKEATLPTLAEKSASTYFLTIEKARELNESLVYAFIIAIVLGMTANAAIKSEHKK